MDALLKDVLGAFPEAEIDTPSPKKRKATEKVKDKVKDGDKEGKDKEKEEEVVKPEADEPDTSVNVKPWLWKPPDGSQSNYKGYSRPYGNQGYQGYRGGYQGGGGGGYQGGGGYNGGRGSFGGNGGGYNNNYSQRRFQPYGQGQGDSGFRSSYYSSNGNFPPGSGTGNDRGGFKKNF